MPTAMRARPWQREGDDGFATVSLVAAVAVSLVAFVAVANLLVLAYARGAARVALDEGARAGARAGDPAAACVARAEATLDDLLGGSLRAAWQPVDCDTAGQQVTASVRGHLPAWAPGVPDWRVSQRAAATAEPPPRGDAG
jgi:hypothetical protein